MNHVIIVEDDPMVAHINREYLQRFPDFQVDRTFRNGQEALVYLRHNHADLIILDQYMPVLSGNELLKALHTENIRTSVIMITSATEIGIVEEALRYGVTDYLIKPFSFTRFEEAVKRYLFIKDLIRNTPSVSQSDIDRLLRDARKPEPEGPNILSKGLNQQTLDHLLDYLKEHPGDEHTSKSISDSVGLSKVTVRRYLNYLIDSGQVRSSIDYDTGGRPRILYRYIPAGDPE